MRYFNATAISGLGWFCVAAILGHDIPIIGREMWLPHVVCALITSLCIGYTFKKPIATWHGLRWYLLPFLTILGATTLFGFLVPISWWVKSKIERSGGVDGEAFYLLPFYIILYSMTVWLVVLYPLALLTQTLLRKVSRTTQADQVFFL